MNTELATEVNNFIFDECYKKEIPHNIGYSVVKLIEKHLNLSLDKLDFNPPPFFPELAPKDIIRTYELHLRKDNIEQFYFTYHDIIDWKKHPSKKGETPIDHDSITIERLETIGKNNPVEVYQRHYAGVMTTKLQTMIQRKEMYIYLYNPKFFKNKPQICEKVLNQMHGFVIPYHNILHEIVQQWESSKYHKFEEN